MGLCLLLVFLLASCTSLGPTSEAPPSIDRARALDSSGDYAGAARVYEALAAQNTGTEQNALLLQAALEHLRARKPDDAQRVLASINPPLSADQTFERQMLNVELALARNQGQGDILLDGRCCGSPSGSRGSPGSRGRGGGSGCTRCGCAGGGSGCSGSGSGCSGSGSGCSGSGGGRSTGGSSGTCSGRRRGRSSTGRGSVVTAGDQQQP